MIYLELSKLILKATDKVDEQASGGNLKKKLKENGTKKCNKGYMK